MNKVLKEKLSEAFSSVLPITVIVMLLCILFAPVPNGTVVMFLLGAVMLVVGMGLFSLGADIAMMPMGEGIGVEFTRAKKLWLVIPLIFGMGVLITVAEPDLQVLAGQVASVPSFLLIICVSVGVGIFLVVSVLRILFRYNLKYILMGCYLLASILAFFASADFIPVAFDSGGVTTGPITVPFILALGFGLSSMRSDKNSGADSFGLVALCSIGPILAVLILGICSNSSSDSYTPMSFHDIITTRDATREFIFELPQFTREVLTAIIPIMLFFAFFQAFTRRYKKRQIARMLVGFAYTIAGLVIFLTGVNVGFIPMGYLIGHEMAASTFKWLLLPVSMLVGYFIVSAEPAVHILNKQVEQISGGAIPAKAMYRSLSIGVAVSVGLSILRIYIGINLFWFLIPGYVISMALSFFVPDIFVGIAFDSGGVATGPMTTTFLLPFAIGACVAVSGNVMTDAFGVVAMVAMTPLITIQSLGVVYRSKMKAAAAEAAIESIEHKDLDVDELEIVDYKTDKQELEERSNG